MTDGLGHFSQRLWFLSTKRASQRNPSQIIFRPTVGDETKTASDRQRAVRGAPRLFQTNFAYPTSGARDDSAAAGAEVANRAEA